MEYVAGKLGDVDVWNLSTSVSESFGTEYSQSESKSLSQQRRRLLGAQTFRSLAPQQAVALLSVAGSSYDDVLLVPQITSDDLA